ncbi:MAG: hypothetical protein LBQ09_07320 [Acidobacteriaceae bacterium]|nr:hypothetical protein [Acidobacteriaceae bacterium]
MNGCIQRVLAVIFLGVSALPVAAQIPAAPAAGTVNVEVDPIRCWWRTSAGAVRIGEQFNLSLTCAVLENDAVQVFVDESRMGHTVIQLSPFEVVDGSHPADMHAGARRFFQYQYTLRIINPDVIGRDLGLPPMTLHYRINSRVAGNAAVQGRDLVYVMPPQSVRVLSMVPNDASDIRDELGENFANAERLQYRASVLELVAATAVVLGVLMVLAVLVRLARGSRAQTPLGERLLPASSIVSAACGELAHVQQEREGQGWTDALAARAQTATRIVAAYALGRTASQRPNPADALPGDGGLVVRPTARGKARLVSSPVTIADLTRAAKHPERATVPDAIDPLSEALTTFTNAQYGRTTALDQSALDSALATAMAGASEVKRRYNWLSELLAKMRRQPATPAESRA